MLAAAPARPRPAVLQTRGRGPGPAAPPRPRPNGASADTASVWFVFTSAAHASCSPALADTANYYETNIYYFDYKR